MHGLLMAAAMQVPLPMPAGPGFGPSFENFTNRRLTYIDTRFTSPADIAMARVLIMSPVSDRDAVPSDTEWPRLSAALHQAAIAMEILDPAERIYICADAKDLQVDLNILRDRWSDLRDAPTAAEVSRFAFSRNEACDAVYFNRAFRAKVELRMEIETDRRDELRDAMSLVDQHYVVWDALRDAKADHYHVTVRRQALKKLKLLIGPEAFAAGGMPLPVPKELFREMP